MTHRGRSRGERMLREGDERGHFSECFLHVESWTLNSCGRDKRAWEEWIFRMEKERQWHSMERLPLLLLPSCSLKTSGYHFAASAAIQGRGVLGEQRPRGVKEPYVYGKWAAAIEIAGWCKINLSLPHVLKNSRLFLQSLYGVQTLARPGKSRVTLSM